MSMNFQPESKSRLRTPSFPTAVGRSTGIVGITVLGAPAAAAGVAVWDPDWVAVTELATAPPGSRTLIASTRATGIDALLPRKHPGNASLTILILHHSRQLQRADSLPA